jgi:hypothetical protein
MPKLPLGFEFKETMTGTYTRAHKPAESLAIRFSLRAVADDALAHLRDHLMKVQGTLEMEGFADEAACAGTLYISLPLERIIRYELAFVGNDGLPYRLTGQKDIRLMDFVGSMTTLPARVLDAAGQEVAKLEVRFDVKADLLTFLASWKPRFPHAA